MGINQVINAMDTPFDNRFGAPVGNAQAPQDNNTVTEKRSGRIVILNPGQKIWPIVNPAQGSIWALKQVVSGSNEKQPYRVTHRTMLPLEQIQKPPASRMLDKFQNEQFGFFKFDKPKKMPNNPDVIGYIFNLPVEFRSVVWAGAPVIDPPARGQSRTRTKAILAETTKLLDDMEEAYTLIHKSNATDKDKLVVDFMKKIEQDFYHILTENYLNATDV